VENKSLKNRANSDGKRTQRRVKVRDRSTRSRVKDIQ
jgi:hypothetical protein